MVAKRIIVWKSVMKLLGWYPSMSLKFPLVTLMLESKGYAESVSRLSLLHTRFHEHAHAQLPYRWSMQQMEREAELQAFKELMELGYGFDEIVRDETDVRWQTKYGVGIEEFKKLLSPLPDPDDFWDNPHGEDEGEVE